ncbi:type VII secretion-associated serine protease mycosin [Dactylosporangium sp. AC04546]|uniref:type VII secretion-associated serine protease mycosin n=1 Tax=Dactylosporangium sp. AC04546 TaxID=2862460 RepID=UPI001EE01C1D|nr:type VII secretion-associated serine protease mycosin [Dactylosporangium sp. AC04546]WVK81431.1 type VII secretion-associated serine protease mycosin [Dactylosporangium sp. AC04546]
MQLGNRWTARVLTVALLGVAAPALPVLDGVAVAACGPSFSDQLTDTPWPLARLHPEAAWPLTTGAGVTVAVIDNGVSTLHPSLKGQVLPGKNYVATGAADCDLVAHGTFVAGIIAGLRLPNTGFHGVAPGAKILPIRVVEDDQKSHDTNLPNVIADAINFAVDSNAAVINLSLVTQNTPQLAAAVARAVSRNVIVVAAAGNDGATQTGNQPAYPAAYDGVIAVAGVDENDKHVATSTTGDFVDVAAPGVRIQGPAPQGGGFGLRSGGGTSFAAPYVAGTAALLRAYYPNATAKEITDRITATADHPPAGRDQEVGYGVVNPYRAVATIQDGPAAAPPAASRAAGLNPNPAGTTDSHQAAIWTTLGALLLTALVWAGLIAQRARRRTAGDDLPQLAPARSRPARPGGRSRDDEPSSEFTVRGPAVRHGAAARGLAAAERRGLSMPTATGGTGPRARP